MGLHEQAQAGPGSAGRIGELVIEAHDDAEAVGLAGELGALHAAAHAGTAQQDEPFYSAEQFADRLQGYLASPGFRLVTARAGDDLVGYVFGYVLPVGTRWWLGLLDPAPEEFTIETGSRTFALNELHVRADYRGVGVASAMHATLLAGGQQERVTVLVRADNPALNQYEHWGYEQIGRLQPSPDSPQYLGLVLTPSAGESADHDVVRSAPSGPEDAPAHPGDLLNPA